jgi:DNA-binding response OmpR family regulator
MEGFKVSSSNGTSVMEKINSFKPHVVIMDIWMAGKSGIEYSKEIKSNTVHKHIYVILASATTNVSQFKKESMADDTMDKPFEVELLAKKLKALPLT